jgi:hypothetical protein
MRAKKCGFITFPPSVLKTNRSSNAVSAPSLEWALQIEEIFLRHDAIMLVDEVLSKPRKRPTYKRIRTLAAAMQIFKNCITRTSQVSLAETLLSQRLPEQCP